MAGIFPILVLELLASYGLQLSVFSFVCAGNVNAALLMILAGFAAIPVINILFGLLNKAKGWFEKKEILAVVCIGALIYVGLMFLLFPRFEIPYQLLPRGEMAAGYGQLVIQFADCAGGAVCFVVSGIWILYARNRE